MPLTVDGFLIDIGLTVIIAELLKYLIEKNANATLNFSVIAAFIQRRPEGNER